MIRAEDFSFTYPIPTGMERASDSGFFRKALDRISLTVDEGDFVLLTGGSGSGKSTLLLALSGMIPHVTGGKIGGALYLGGKEIRTLNPSVLSETAGAAFQNPHTQLFTPTVREEIAFPLQNRGIPSGEMEEKILRALEFTGLAGYEERNPRELSGGEKQRLLLAVLLAWDPPLYLLDEPLSALDPRGAEQILELLKTLNREKGKTIILAEKNREGGEFHRRYHLSGGRLVKEEPLSFPVYPPVPGKDYSRGASLNLSGLDFAYPGGLPLFNDFSLNLNPGETIGLSGANGTGKTTLASLLMGFLKPTAGQISRGGQDLGGFTVAQRAGVLSYLFQNPDHQLFASSLREEIGFGLPEKEKETRVDEILEAFGLKPWEKIPPAMLSFALRKRVALAAAAARDTPFMILDEPDWGQDREGMEIIRRFVGQGAGQGRGFLLIS
ncbi:MAG: ABC transporter ATP-binding protein, partial [Spirochaetales bacterium]|nr:ABC transporter ATP-binding protein [Spirochaetales bacterium]